MPFGPVTIIFYWPKKNISGQPKASPHFRHCSTIKIQLSMLVYYKADLIIISLKINLYSPLCSWKIAELALNNSHSIIDGTRYLVRPFKGKRYLFCWESEGKLKRLSNKSEPSIMRNRFKLELSKKLGLSWLWSYGSWIYNYLCNQCLSPLTYHLGSLFLKLFLAHLTRRVRWAIAITWHPSSSYVVNFFKNLLLWKY